MKPYYERDGITIYNSDCLEAMPQLDLVFDAIICDLPYGTTACSWDTIIPFEPLWENYKRLVKAKGAVVLFGSQPFTSKLVMSNFDQLKYLWVWDKKGTANFALAKSQPLRATEDIIIFGKGLLTFNPQMKKGKMRGKGGGGKCSINGISPTYTVNDDYYPTNIIRISNANFPERGLHPTQKPVALLAYLIRTYTNPGEIILDNTAGSFTTAVACIKEGRRFVGIEKEEEYCRIGKERIIEALLASGNVQASCDTIDTQKLGYQLGLPLQDYQIPEKV
jgi:site-specific DNA-methyltransferase (adenine-specific)